MVHERCAGLVDDVHQSADAKHRVGLRGAGAASHDQLARLEPLDASKYGAKGIGLRDAGLVVFGCPRVVRFHRDTFAGDERLEGNRLERVIDCCADIRAIQRDHDVWHG